MAELPTRYSAPETEPKWYAAWEEAGLFSPDPDPGKPKYCITIPPPNITGSLHMGHALCYPLQDVFGRYKRLTGHSVLVLPGQDHAGIATQAVVDKTLRKEGLSASKLGREKFVERVWEWRQEYGDTILRQLRAFGCAFDWSRTRFTLDEQYASAVLEVFISWFERGLIYQGHRVVNWDPVMRTSVSDIETERKTIQGHLYYIRYPFADGSGSVTIATTRPETMLADVAVAVHPRDERYKSHVGKRLLLPLVGREIPLIADHYPDPAYGTGAVKITPAHDPNDYEVGVRHQLPMPVVLDETAKITEEGGKYKGLDRYEARKRVLEDLEAGGYLEKTEPCEIAVLVSDRSKEVIEPLLRLEWFVAMKSVAGDAIRVVEEGRVKFTPARFTGIYLDWMNNIRDWNISRRLWWGHRVPVYYTAEEEPFAATSWEEAQAKAGDKKIVRQDDAVLDTWFSSGLWPFATLGWPTQTDDLSTYYPTDLLITDRNIIYLWVSRMIMMGLDFMGEIPFHDVFIYATVLNEKGQRMSKSLGTGVDPMEVIESRGADALRFTLFSQTGENQEIRYSERRTEDARNFCNKIWNASRFVLLNLEGPIPAKPEALEPIDRWLLSRLARTERAVRHAYDTFDLQAACQALYTFFWNDYCDWTIEISKSRLGDPTQRDAPLWTLLTALRHFLVMLHPIMPHLTEEVYSHLPFADKAEFVMKESWPELPGEWLDEPLEEQVEHWQEVTRAIRALRAEAGLAALRTVDRVYAVGDMRGGEEVIRSQAWINDLTLQPPTEGRHLQASSSGVALWLPIQGLIDTEAELARLAKEKGKLQEDLDKLERRLANPEFRAKAKSEIVEREEANATELRAKLASNEERHKLFSAAD